MILNYIFFLGGYDAEMCEIRKILEDNQIPFNDKKLSWGAKASAYAEELENSGNAAPALVELEVDIPLPENRIIIDHHSENSGKDVQTSIEQAAELLGIKLTRRQKLIAANDRGWIDGLKQAGAAEEEIAEIRLYDRQCQGVTEEEEQAAEKAIRNIEMTGNVAVVHFPGKHTSPVMDRLYGKYTNILVITPETINFSGEGKYVQKLAAQFPNGWYGGELPEKGFWGMEKQKNFRIEKILNTLEGI